MKYVNTGVVFQEIPDEVTLSINISNCPCHCPGCHSEYLWDDIGTPLTVISLGMMLDKYGEDVTCVCFMGGDADTQEIDRLAEFIRRSYPKLKVGWYSGRSVLSPYIHLENFNYVKLGPYIESRGGLNMRTTNQRLYKVSNNNELKDITCKFWKK